MNSTKCSHRGPRLQTRRRFLQNAAVLGGALSVGGFAPERGFSQSLLPPPETSGIEHIVVLMMENRSFDHMMGWVEGADGRQHGLRYRDDDGTQHRTSPLAPDFQGCGHPDPDHSYEGGRVEYNNRACTDGCAQETTTNMPRILCEEGFAVFRQGGHSMDRM